MRWRSRVKPALVTELVARGLEVVATTRRVGDLADLAAAERLQLDITSGASVAAAAERADPVDLLVNNAGISAAATVEDTPAEVAAAMFDTNVVGPLRMISAFVPGMRGTARPVAVTALASASACLLAPLYFVAEPFAWAIPAGRFPGLVVSGIAGARLARSRHSPRH